MIILALNEINIDLVKGYIQEGRLKNFKLLFENGVVKTESEKDYHLLEPWIQWVTVHSGLTFKEHQIFRLGDIVLNPHIPQFFEVLEKKGVTIGAISPFNLENRLQKPEFFVPDPWTQTNASGNYFLLKLSKAISNFVNSNATGRFGIQDVMWVILGLFIFIPLKRWLNLIRLLVKVKKPGVKATILDVILSELFISLRNTRVPDLAYLFLNGGAHIQHHYFFNSASYTGNLRNPEWYCPNDWDPVYEILDVYDNLIGDLIKSGDKLLCITALHQVPHEEETYYWRPINHESFLLEFGLVKPFRVVPRMSRDFLIVADDEQELSQMQETLSSFVDSHKGGQVFAVDNRGLSLFVEIVYDGPITSDLFFKNASGCSVYNLDSKLAFVAIKNGKHHRTGFLFSNFSLDSLDETIPLTRVRDFVESIALSDLDKKIQK